MDIEQTLIELGRRRAWPYTASEWLRLLNALPGNEIKIDRIMRALRRLERSGFFYQTKRETSKGRWSPPRWGLTKEGAIGPGKNPFDSETTCSSPAGDQVPRPGSASGDADATRRDGVG